MDWENERYIKRYTRETIDELSITAEGRAVWDRLLLRCDRAGVIDTGGDLAHMHELLRVPKAWFERAFPLIVARKMVVVSDRAILLPNFLDAQAARASNAQRQRDFRERRRDKEAAREILQLSLELSQPDTDASQPVTECSGTVKQTVTSVDGGVTETAHKVTTRVEETRVEETRQESDAPARDIGRGDVVRAVWATLQATVGELIAEGVPGNLIPAMSSGHMRLLAQLREYGDDLETAEAHMRHVIKVLAAEARITRSLEWLDGIATWSSGVVAKARQASESAVAAGEQLGHRRGRDEQTGESAAARAASVAKQLEAEGR